jgi:hypothetical protein
MAASRPSPWPVRVCFWLSLTAAGLLMGLVILTPYLNPPSDKKIGLGRLLLLVAHDAAVRQTALACSLGLAVTAAVFFRTSSKPHAASATRSKPSPPPSRMIGA